VVEATAAELRLVGPTGEATDEGVGAVEGFANDLSVVG
jgi:hypothetical protein